jgi:hypothetical protein
MSQILPLPDRVPCEPSPRFGSEGLLVFPPYGRSEAFFEDIEPAAPEVDPLRAPQAMRRFALQR